MWEIDVKDNLRFFGLNNFKIIYLVNIWGEFFWVRERDV